MEKNKVETTIDKNRVIFKRFYDAPIDLVFEAWTLEEHLSQWWGPEGFTITTKSFQFSNGGIWNFIMHGPDGSDYDNKIQFIEIIKPSSISYKHIGDDVNSVNVLFYTNINFTEENGGTNIRMELILPSEEELQRLAKDFGAIEGGEQHVTKLGQYLESLKKNRGK